MGSDPPSLGLLETITLEHGVRYDDAGLAERLERLETTAIKRYLVRTWSMTQADIDVRGDEGMKVMIPISSIDAGGIDSFLQGESHAARVASLVKALTEGAEVPPITVFQACDKRFLADGRHRLRAHQVAGRTEIAADLIHVRSLDEWRIEKALFLEAAARDRKSGTTRADHARSVKI